jgi:uncharacterized protein
MDLIEVRDNVFEIVELVAQAPGTKHAVVCLPDAGLVGTIAGMHLVTTLGLELVGYIDTELMPPLAIVHNQQIRPPIQIYANKQLLVIVSEIPLTAEATRPVATALVRYLQQLRPKSVTALGGTPLPPATRSQLERPEVYAVTNVKVESKRLEAKGIKLLDEGIVAGANAIILLEAQRRSLSLTYLMAQSFLNIPDPGAAAEALKALSEITGVPIATDKLVEGAEEVRVKVRDLMSRTTNAMEEGGKQHELQIPAFYQ